MVVPRGVGMASPGLTPMEEASRGECDENVTTHYDLAYLYLSKQALPPLMSIYISFITLTTSRQAAWTPSDVRDTNSKTAEGGDRRRTAAESRDG